MKGTGFGSFEGIIVVRVAEKDILVVQEKTGVTPERRAGDDSHGYFVLPWTVFRRGDDETILFELGNMLGDTIDWRINWAESQY